MKRSIMVVDDDEDIRDIVKMLLESFGYPVETARDGLEAWESLNDGRKGNGGEGPKPALILLDLMMPRMDGETFLRRLRESRNREIPVVVMSGHRQGPEKAKELRANAMLTKPVHIADLLDAIERHADRSDDG